MNAQLTRTFHSLYYSLFSSAYWLTYRPTCLNYIRTEKLFTNHAAIFLVKMFTWFVILICAKMITMKYIFFLFFIVILINRCCINFQRLIWKHSISHACIIVLQDRTHITPYYETDNMPLNTQNLDLIIKCY